VAQSPSLELPAAIAADVPFLKFSEALARAGLMGRRDAARGVLVIEPIPPLCVSCGGTGLDEDAVCDDCDGAGREGAARRREPPFMTYTTAAII
jgi:hypothetical protein